MSQNKRTTIITGAGASHDYGFPTGHELIQDILLFALPSFEPNYKKDIFSSLQPRIQDFGSKLGDTALSSIDSFLTMHAGDPDFVKIGKTLIGHEIIKRQHDGMAPRGKHGWYSVLYEFLSANGWSRLRKDEVRIITFNYDLSLEFFIERQLEHDPRLTEADRNEIIELLLCRIHHVYGSVYDYPHPPTHLELQPRSKKRYSFFNIMCAEGPNLFNVLYNADIPIKVIGEDRDTTESPRMEEFRTYLQESNTIFFFGFGFNDENVKLLEIQMRNRKFRYTNHGSSKIIDEKITEMNMHDSRGFNGGIYEALTSQFRLE